MGYVCMIYISYNGIWYPNKGEISVPIYDDGKKEVSHLNTILLNDINIRMLDQHYGSVTHTWYSDIKNTWTKKEKNYIVRDA